jgi:hypothetical protein
MGNHRSKTAKIRGCISPVTRHPDRKRKAASYQLIKFKVCAEFFLGPTYRNLLTYSITQAYQSGKNGSIYY